MRYTWWVTRPKRSLSPVPLVLTAMVKGSDGMSWAQQRTETGLKIEAALEAASLKRVGARRDQSAGGARTYRAWLKSLGLIFMRNGELHLTWAGQELLEGKPPLPILSKQVLNYQFPSAFTAKGASAVAPEFNVRPFVLLLKLLTDERLGGYLREAEDVAKIAVCYGLNHSEAVYEDVVERILSLRREGDRSLDPEYLDKFKSSRANEATLEQLFGNLRHIANTFGNWLGYTQLITREAGVWKITSGAEQEVAHRIHEAEHKPLIADATNEEKFQRRYGLTPGRRKDTRNLDETKAATTQSIDQNNVEIAFQALASTQLIERVTPKIIFDISYETGVKQVQVERILAKKYPNGAIDGFMNEYAQMAFESRDRATDFEKATTSIFREVFGFKAEHIGMHGRRPDVVISSESAKYGAILDSKAYKKGYSLGVVQQNRMRDYVRDYPQYRLADYPLAFYSYVVSDYKDTVTGQLQSLSTQINVDGSIITARDIIRMVTRHRQTPFTHDEIRELLSGNAPVTFEDFGELTSGAF